MKKVILSILLVLLMSFGAYAQVYQTDLILTKPDAVWVDSRSYNSLDALLTAIGSDETTIYIAQQEDFIGTIPDNVRLKFLTGGSINATGAVTINAKFIDAPNVRIFYGSGAYDFASGSELKSAWFEDFDEVVSETSDDEVTIIMSQDETATTNASIGDDVVLRWNSPGNELTISSGIVISNVDKIIAGDYQIVSGDGRFDFNDGIVLKSTWFSALNEAGRHIDDTIATLEVRDTESISYDYTFGSNITLHFYDSINISVGKTITIYSPRNVIARPNQQIFSGDGSISFTNGGVIYPNWHTKNTTPGVTDMSTAIQWAITQSQDKGGTVHLLPETYKLGTIPSGNNELLEVTKGRITIEGEGWDSILVMAQNEIGIYCQADGAEQEGLVLRDFKIDSDGYSQLNAGIIQINGFWGFLCDNIWLTNGTRASGSSGTNGISVARTPDPYTSAGTIRNCLLENFSKAAINVTTGARYVEIDGCIVRNAAMSGSDGNPTGIEIDAAYFAKVTNCSVYGNGIHGIAAGPDAPGGEDRTFGCVISNNTVYGNGQEGIGHGIIVGNAWSAPDQPIIISGNYVEGNGVAGGTTSSGIVVQNSNGIIITNNIVRGNNVNGISVDRCNRITVEGNQCESNNIGEYSTVGGIYISGGEDTYSDFIISNNICTDTQDVKTQDYGIVFMTGTINNVIMKGNNLGGNELGPIWYIDVPEIQAEQETVYIGSLDATDNEEHFIHAGAGVNGSFIYDVLLVDRSGVAAHATDTRIFSVLDGDGHIISDINTDTDLDNVTLVSNTPYSMKEIHAFSQTHNLISRDEAVTLSISHGGSGAALTDLRAVVRYITW